MSISLGWVSLACAPPEHAPTQGLEEPCIGPCVPAHGEPVAGWTQVAVDGHGVAWVSWVEVSGPAVVGVFVARSDAPDAQLSAPIPIETAEPPVIGSTEKPSLAASDDRLALAYTGRGTLRHGDAKVVYVQVADLSGSFDPALQIDSLAAADRVTEQVRVAFDGTGELWAAWKRQVYGLEDHPHWARESDGFVPVEISSALSESHDCSPPDFRFGPSDRPLYTMRSNIDGMLQTVTVVGENEPVQVSADTWAYSPDVCPTDGPRVVEQSDGTLVVAWLAPEDEVWRLHTAMSTDGGATFGPPTTEDRDVGLGERWVAMVAEHDRVWTAVESVDRSTRLAATDVAEQELVSPAGQPLSDVELAANAGRVVAIGKDPDGVWWLVDLHP